MSVSTKQDKGPFRLGKSPTTMLLIETFYTVLNQKYLLTSWMEVLLEDRNDVITVKSLLYKHPIILMTLWDYWFANSKGHQEKYFIAFHFSYCSSIDFSDRSLFLHPIKDMIVLFPLVP